MNYNQPLKVLFVDDDTLLGSAVTLGLQIVGYDIHYQSSLTAIHTIITDYQPNIIVLDVEIGRRNGITDLGEVRKLLANYPLLYVSSHTDPYVIDQALQAGGIAFIKKPFDIVELLAYIKRHARIYSHNVNFITLGKFIIDRAARELRTIKDNSTIQLTKKEFKLLNLLYDNLDETVSKQTVWFDLWEQEGEINDQIISNNISNIRKALAPDLSLKINTIHKEGYKFSIEECDQPEEIEDPYNITYNVYGGKIIIGD